jgi:hypothetical protein
MLNPGHTYGTIADTMDVKTMGKKSFIESVKTTYI